MPQVPATKSRSSVGNFLDGLGLSKYAEVFDKHEIDMVALRLMSENDLANVGIPMGPRVKIVRAFSESTFL